MKKKILILGGNGYIGSRLTNFLSTKYSVSVLDLENNNPDVIKEFIRCDVTDRIQIKNSINKFYDVIINLISLDSIRTKKFDSQLVNKINVMPALNFLELLEKKNRSFRFINFSSIHVYGNSLLDEIDENGYTNPNSLYGLTHLMREKIINYFNNKPNINSINLRLSNSYGEPYVKNDHCWNLVINNLCFNAVKSGKIEIQSNLSNSRNFIHYHDVCRAVDFFINTELNEHNTYNLCGDSSISFKELVEIVKKQYNSILNKKLIVSVLNNSNQNQNTNYSNKRLKNLGFNNTISIDDGINKIIQHLVNGKKLF